MNLWMRGLWMNWTARVSADSKKKQKNNFVVCLYFVVKSPRLDIFCQYGFCRET